MMKLGCGQVQRHKDKNRVCCNYWLCDRCLAFYAFIGISIFLIAIACYNF